MSNCHKLNCVFLITAFFISILAVSLPARGIPGQLFENSRPAVCLVEFYKNITAHSEIGTFMKRKQHRIGVIVNPNGLVMVSHDVYPLSLDILSGNGGSFFSGEPTDFKVKLSGGKEYDAIFVGKDDRARVAFIQIQNPPPDLPTAKFVSTEEIRIGHQIYLVELLGESYNFEPLFTPLTVNAVIPTPRKKFLVKNYEPALSSGGLVLDENGNPIGVTIQPQFEFSFHSDDFEDFQKKYLEIAPSEWFMGYIENPPVLEKEIFRGKAWLGIRMQSLTPRLKEFWKVSSPGGIIINDISPESPADAAGLQIGDVIIELNDETVDINRDEDLNKFREKISGFSPETEIELTIFRNGKIVSKNVRLHSAPRSIDLADSYQLPELGLEVRELTRDILYNSRLPLSTSGVYVYRVDRASPAGMGGLSIGHIITHVNQKPVKNLNTFKRLIQESLNHNSPKIMFRVQQHRETHFIFVEK